MSTLRWDEAVAAGVVTDDEADLMRECVQRDQDGVWRVDVTGLDQPDVERLERAIRWFCSVGGVQ